MASQKHKNMWRMKWKHGFRNVKRGGLPFYFAAFMIGLGLLAYVVISKGAIGGGGGVLEMIKGFF
jgi:hypothetical protein